MTRLFLVLGIILLLATFIWMLKNHLARDNKIDELRKVELESDLMDIDKDIAKEKAHQKNVSSEIDELNSVNNKNEKESSND
ncbi:MAG: hypothetical protein V7745_03655 [Pseudomonadales bacterium]